MKPESQKHFETLVIKLDELVKVYRHLLNIVRKERDILKSAALNELNENNRAKEAMLIRARELEEERIEAALQLARHENLHATTRLLEFAKHVGGSEGERLRQLHTVLDLLLKRVREHNSHNEVLVNSALDTVTGAMGSIRETLAAKPTYQRSGSINDRTAESGQLVSKEA